MSTRARNLCPMLVLTFLLNGGVVPEYVVPLSVFSLGGRIWFVVKSVTVSAFVESFLVWRGGLVK